jgi:hypothetical protein
MMLLLDKVVTIRGKVLSMCRNTYSSSCQDPNGNSWGQAGRFLDDYASVFTRGKPCCVEGSSNYAGRGKTLKDYYPDNDIACDVSFRKIVPA